MIRNLLLTFLLSFSLFSTYGQVIAWQFGVPESLGNEVTYNSTTTNINLNTSILSRGGGIAVSALARAFSATDFNASGTKAQAITSNDYFQTSINAKPGFQVSLATLDARLRRSSTGPNAYVWAYSLNGTTFTEIGTDISFTDVNTNGVVQATIDLSSISALQNVTSSTTITFRLYAWGASALTGTFAFGRYAASNTTNSLAFGGTVTPVMSGCTPPAVLASGFMGSNPTSNSFDISWTAPTDGDGVIILAKANVPVDADPISGTPYTPSTSFGSGSEIGTGNFVIYQGNGTTTPVTNLSAGSTYHFEIYNYNITGDCYMSSGLTGSFATSGPDIQLEFPISTNIACGATIPFGAVGNGMNSDLTFRIRNVGTTDLLLSDYPLSMIGMNPDQFSVFTQPSGLIAAGSFSDVTVRFSPTSVGSKGAAISLASNDGDEAACQINFTGTGVTNPMFYRSIGSGSWTSTATWESSPDNVTFIPATSTPSNEDNSIIIQTGNIVTVSSNLSIDETVIQAGATLEVLSGALIIADGTGTDLSVDGIWKLTDGTITIPGSLVEVNNGGTFQYNKITASTLILPMCIWNTGSTCEIIASGIATAMNSSANQTYYNFVWNNTGQPNGVNMSGNVHTINGDFSIINTGPTLEELRLTGGTTTTLSVAGNVIVEAEAVLNLSNGNGISTLNIGGDLDNEGSIVLCSDNSSPYGSGIINLSGDMLSLGSITKIGANTGNKIVMSGTSLQVINSPGGITGAVALEINNSAGVKLDNHFSIDFDLILTNGLVYTANSNFTVFGAISGASDTKYIATSDELNISSTVGGLTRIVDITVPANQLVVFPIGPNSTYYMPATLDANAGTDFDNFTARVNPLGTGGVNATDPTKCIQYQWEIENSGAPANINLTLQWDAGTEGSNFVPGANLVIGHWNGVYFDVIDPASYNAADPSATSLSGLTDFSPFVVASEDVALPLTWIKVSATKEHKSVKVSWSTTNEVDNKLFEIERSSDGKSFERIGQKAAASNPVTINSYSFIDIQPGTGVNYYRIKQIDLNGKSSYSPVATVDFDPKTALTITNYGQKMIVIDGVEGNGLLQVFDVNGKIVAMRQVVNSETFGFDNLENGVYFCKLENNARTTTLKFNLSK